MADMRRAQAASDGETVLASVEIAAAPERIVRALTTEEVHRGWGTRGVYRPGRWRLGSLCFQDGVRVQRRVYELDHPTCGRRETTITYRLEPTASGTRVSVRQEGFGRPNRRRRRARGRMGALAGRGG